MKKVLLISIIIAAMIIAAPVSALGVSGSIWRGSLMPNGTAQHQMYIFLSGSETDTNITVTPSADYVTVDKPVVFVPRGRYVPVTATIRAPAELGQYRSEIILAFPPAQNSGGIGINYQIAVPIILTVRQPICNATMCW